MPYKNLADLEKDLTTKNGQALVEVVNDIYMQDTTKSMPWIFEILCKKRTEPHWQIAHYHWMKLRQQFRKTEDSAQSEIKSDKPISIPEDTEILENNTVQSHIQHIANAFEAIEVTKDNYFAALLLTCVVCGLNKRLNDLDQGHIENFGYNRIVLPARKIANAGLTRLIIAKMGQNRIACFKPIHEAIEVLVNKNILLREHIPEQIIPLKTVSLSNQTSPFNDPSSKPFTTVLNEATLIAELNKLSAEIHKIENTLTQHLKNKPILEQTISWLQELKLKIIILQSKNGVMEYDEQLAEKFQLDLTEKQLWSNCAKAQDASYFSQLLSYPWQKIWGNPDDPNKVNEMLLTKISHQLVVCEKQLVTIPEAQDYLQQLKRDEQVTQTTLEQLRLTLKNKSDDNKPSTEPYPPKLKSVEIKLENKKQMELPHPILKKPFSRVNPQKPVIAPAPKQIASSRWKSLLRYIAGIGIGGMAGFAIGLAIGTVVGVALGGIASVFTIPFAAKLGVFIGCIAGGITVMNPCNKKAITAPTSHAHHFKSVSPSNKAINKKLGIHPAQIKPVITSTPPKKIRSVVATFTPPSSPTNDHRMQSNVIKFNS